MIIIPAIDLKGGRCVRLLQGRASDEKVYSDDPVEVARRWAGEGAERLHVVDLDGAFGEKPVHTDLIADIAEAIDIPVEVGGGLRSSDDIVALVDSGVRWVIFGTKALSDPEGFSGIVSEFGDRVIVGIDAREGLVQVKGWCETTDIRAVELAEQVGKIGVNTIIFTDTSRDGMMRGVNVPAFNEICGATSCDVIASGGVTGVDDIRNLCSIKKDNLIGVIVGKALYEGSVNFSELVKESKKEG